MSMVLRDVREDDATVITTWKRDPYVKRMALDPDSVVTVDGQIADIRQALTRDGAIYRIIEVDQQPIGYVRVDFVDARHDVAWLRFALGERRGEGWATSALNQFLTELFDGGCHRIEGEVYAFNEPSKRTLEHLGFRCEGTKRQAHFDGTDYVDVLIYGLIAEDLRS